jgi:BirA family biotin operon repressor/biotin-[acetyl-CoA-carboxylase] ligase
MPTALSGAKASDAGPLTADELEHALAGLRLGRPLYAFAQIGSTNDEARRLAEAGAPEGTLVVAEEQTAGRGRAGRRWLTPPGAALAFSLVLRPKLAAAEAGRLTMLAGLAAVEAIDAIAPGVAALKWPNDVLAADQKAGGILVETEISGDRLDFAVVGIGLNVSFAPAPEVVAFPATALEAAAGAPVDRGRLLRGILERLDEHYAHLPAQPGSDPLHARWAARLAWLGETVSVRQGEGETVGRAEAVDPDGALILRLASGAARRVRAGDVRLRRA